MLNNGVHPVKTIKNGHAIDSCAISKKRLYAAVKNLYSKYVKKRQKIVSVPLIVSIRTLIIIYSII